MSCAGWKVAALVGGTQQVLPSAGLLISSFGQDQAGELYVGV
jgi:hypothetical protein